jgi:hypothetical protein
VTALPPNRNKGTYAINQTPDFGYEKLYELQQGFWKRFMFPNNVKEAESINSTIFSDDVSATFPILLCQTSRGIWYST